MKTVYILLFTAINLISSPYHDEAIKAYKAGNYQLVIEKYDSVLRSGVSSPELYYNIGNAYYKQGRAGKAILNYERALKLSPGDDDISFNLKIARAKLIDRIDQTPRFFLSSWFDTAVNFLSANGWTISALITLILFCLLVTVFFLSHNSSARKLSLFSGIAAFGLLIVFSILLSFRYHSDIQQNTGIITAQVIGAKFAPGQSEKDAFVIHEGLKVRVEESSDEWMKIGLDDGKVGWVTKNSIEII